MAWLDSYPYLAGSLVLAGLAGTGLLAWPRERRAMLLSGLLSAPSALFALAFVPEYWNPRQVARFLTGPEDVIFSFANGALAWLLAVGLSRRELAIRPAPRRALPRYAGCTALYFAVSLPGWALGFPVMTASLTGVLGLAVFLGRRDPARAPVAAAGALGFAALYTTLFGAVLVRWPDFLLQWNAASLWGPRLLGVPLDEIAWALAYGAAWPLVMAYVLDATPTVASAAGPPGEGAETRGDP